MRSSVGRVIAGTIPRSGVLLRTSAAYALPRVSLMPCGLRTFANASEAKDQTEKKDTGVKTEAEAGTDANANADKNLTSDQARIKELETQLEAKTKEAAELKDRWMRSVADFRNLQIVTQKDIQRAKDFALQKFAKDLLESVDNFGHALGAFNEEDIKKTKEINDLYTGVRMTRDVFFGTLRKHGIERIDPMGEEFDPNKHEATFQAPQPGKKPGTIFHVQQLGYTLNNRILRPAKVGVVKHEDE